MSSGQGAGAYEGKRAKVGIPARAEFGIPAQAEAEPAGQADSVQQAGRVATDK